MKDDPFAPEHDPYRAVAEGGDERMGRRSALRMVAGVATVACAAAAGCVPTRLACVPGGALAAEPSCEHRFCRYHRRAPG